MRFSIITPSFKNSNFLKLCVASVADQGVDLEHIVQDSCSDDGTQDWLPRDSRVRAYIEKDTGMYDAVNRGLRRASGEILAYLNCDEQYLPGALKAVSNYFETHPRVDVVFGDWLVVDGEGQFICFRKALLPFRPHVMVSHLPAFTCATFFRRNIIDKNGLFFDTRWRDLGDADWVLRLMAAGVPMGILRQYTSTFADTGLNMNLSANAAREKKNMFDSAPFWARLGHSVLVGHHRLRRVLAGAYAQAAFDYAIYGARDLTKRETHHVARPTFYWKSRM